MKSKRKEKILSHLKKIIFTKRYLFLFFIILLLSGFLRFYQFESRTPFGWDQVDNAWAVKNILVEHRLPLVGMQAKLNSGFYIGPLYYYVLAIFYFITNLDPVASAIFALVTSLINSVVLYYVFKKIFNQKVALIGLFLNTVSILIISSDRVQWPVNFIPTFSILIFYFLNKFLIGSNKYLIYLAIAIGLSFNIHFTSIFYPIIVFLTLPFIKFNRTFFKYAIISVFVFLIFLIPNIINEIINSASSTKNLSTYLSTYSHGFHLKRMFQLSKDAFIEFEGYFSGIIKPLKYLLTPIFIIIYLKKNYSKQTLIFCYLIVLWFLIPWLVFTLYSGEISAYYFSITRPIVTMIVSYLTFFLLEKKYFLVRFAVVIFWLYFTFANLSVFFKDNPEGLNVKRAKVLDKIKRGQIVNFTNGDPESYLYFFYTRNKQN